MSEELEKKIVTLEFNNKKFDTNIKKSQRSLESFKKSLNLEEGVKNFEELEKASGEALTPFEKSITVVEKKLTALEMVAFSVINRITNKVIDMGEKFVASMSIDQITSGWAKYESQIASMQTLVHALNEEVEGSAALGFNFASDEDRVAYIDTYQDRLNRFYDETSADAMTAMKVISNYASQQIPLAEAEKAVYGIYALVASAGQPLSSVAEAANVFTKTLGRQFMSGDYFSLSTRMLDTSEFKQLVLDTAAEMGELEKIGDKYYMSQTGSNATGIVGGLNAGILALGNFKSGVSDTEVTLSTFKDTLSKGWLSGKTMSAALAKMGDFWTVLEPIISYTEEQADKAEKLGDPERFQAIYATNWSKLIRAVTKAPKITDAMTSEEQAEALKLQEKARQDFIDGVKEFGYTAKEAEDWYAQIMDDQLEVSRNAFLSLQEAKSFSEAVESIKVGVATRFSTIFQALSGDYLQARTIFTDFSEWLYGYFIEPMNVLADAFSEWSEEGGFDFLYTSTEEFTSLASVISKLIKSITEPLHKVFVEVLNISDKSIKDRLWDIAERLYTLAESLILTEKQQESLGSVFRMVLSVFKAFGKVIGFVWRTTEPLRVALSVIWQTVVDLVTAVSDGIIALLNGKEAEEETIGFFEVIGGAAEVIVGIIYSIIEAATSLFNLIKESGTLESIKNFVTNAITVIGGGFLWVGNAVTELFDNISGYFKGGEANSFTSKISSFFSKASETIKKKLAGKDQTLAEALIGSPEDASNQLDAVSKEVTKGKKSGKVDMLDLAGKEGKPYSNKKTMADVAKSIGGGIVGFLAGVVAAIAKAIRSSKDSVKGIVADLFDIAKNGIGEAFKAIKAVIIDALDFIASIGPKLNAAVAGIAGALIQISIAITALNISSIPRSISTAIAGKARASQMLGIGAIIASVALAIAAIIGAVWALVEMFDKYDTNTIITSLVIVGVSLAAILGMIGTFIVLLMKFANISMPTEFNIKSLNILKDGGLFSGRGKYVQNDNGLYSVAVIIGCVIALLWSLVGAIAILGNIPLEKVWRGFGVLMLSMGILLGLITGLVILIGKFGDLQDPWIKGGIGKGGITAERHGDSMIGRVSGVIWGAVAMMFAVVGALKILDSVDDAKDPGKIWRLFGVLVLSITAVLGMITILYGVVAAINKSRTKVDTITRGLGTNEETVRQSTGMNGDGPLAQLNKVIIALSIFMISFAATAKLLSKIPENAQAFVERMMWTMAAMIGIIFVAIGAIAAFAKNNVDYQSYSKVLTKVGSLMKSMAWSLVIVAIGMAALIGAAMLAYNAVMDQGAGGSSLNLGKLGTLIAVFSIAGGIMVGLFFMAKSFLKEAGKGNGKDLAKAAGMFLIMSLFVTAVAGFITVLVLVASLLHKKKAIWEFFGVLVGIIAIVGAFVSMIKVLEKVSSSDMIKVVGFFALFGAVITAIAVALSLLVGHDWESLLAVSVPMAAIIAGFIVMARVLASVKATQLGATAVTFAAFAFGIAMIAQALVAVSELDQSKFNNAFDNLTQMVVLAGAIAAILSLIGGLYEGLGAVIMLAAGATFVLISAGICLLAESFVIFGKGCASMAKGIQALNGVNFDGLKEFAGAIVDILKNSAGIITLIGLIGTFFGAGFAIVILSIAGTIAIISASIATLIEVLIKLFNVVNTSETESFISRIAELCDMLVAIFNVAKSRIVAIAASIGGAISEGLILGIISALEILTKDDRLYILGYLLSQALSQLFDGLIDGLGILLTEALEEAFDKFMTKLIEDSVVFTRVTSAIASGGLSLLFGKDLEDEKKQAVEDYKKWVGRNRTEKPENTRLNDALEKVAAGKVTGEIVPSSTVTAPEVTTPIQNKTAGYVGGLGNTAAGIISPGASETNITIDNVINIAPGDGMDTEELVEVVVDKFGQMISEKIRGLVPIGVNQ